MLHGPKRGTAVGRPCRAARGVTRMLPLVIQVEDLREGTSTKTAFGKSPVRIGRSELNDLVLPQPFVSQWHAQVEFDDARMEYVDLGSTNGSILGGQPMP